jgi:molybdenum storage protein
MTEIDDHTLISGLGKQLLNNSLNDAALMQATEATPNYTILPWVNVVKIGGQSIIDRGRAAVYPLVEEIVANLGRHKMILGTGAGTRARHIYSLAIDLGLPTGVLTVLGTAVAWQNAQMLHYLLAQHGIPFVEPEGFGALPHYLMERNAVVCQGMPPYKLWEPNPVIVGVGAGVRSRHIFSVGLDLGLPTGALAALSAKDAAQNAYMVSCLLAKHGFVYLEASFVVQLLPAMLAAARGAVFNGIPPYSLWENPPSVGKLPPHGSDAGSYLVAEVFGARSVIFLKDVDGLYTADPKTDSHAELIPEIRAEELVRRNLPTLPIEPSVLELLTRSKLARSVRIVNGLVPGNLSRALAEESVGIVIRE